MIDGLWLVLRAVGLVLTLQAAGAVLFLTVLRAQLTHSQAEVTRSARRVTLAALIVSALQCGLEGARMAGEWPAPFELARLLVASSAGQALVSRSALLLWMEAGLSRAGAARRAMATLAAVGVLLCFLVTGHTAVSPMRVLLAPLLLVHVAAAAFWLGSLWPLRRLAAFGPRDEAARVVAAFSRVAVRLVPLIPLAGLGMALLLLPGLKALWTPYAGLLGVKIALFAALMLLAALNRLRLAPAMARGDAAASDSFRRTVLIEYLLIAVTLAVTAVLTGLYSPSGMGAALTRGAALTGCA